MEYCDLGAGRKLSADRPGDYPSPVEYLVAAGIAFAAKLGHFALGDRGAAVGNPASPDGFARIQALAP